MTNVKWFALGEIAADQFGMFTTRQALSVGYRYDSLTRFLKQGRITRERRNVYRIHGTPVTRWDWVKSLWLSLAPENDPTSLVVSHARAADIYGLGNINSLVTDFTHPEIPVIRTPEYQIHRGTIPQPDWWYQDGIPVTTPRRTVRDLANQGIDGDHLGAVIIDAVQRYGVNLSDLASDLSSISSENGFATPIDFIAHCIVLAGVPTDAVQLTEICSNYLGKSLYLTGQP